MPLKLHICVVFILISVCSKAQIEKDSTSAKKSFEQADSGSLQKLASLDSISPRLSHSADSIQALSSKINSIQDSLSPDLSRYNLSLDSVKQKLTNKIDSLNNLKLPTGPYTRLMDSLNHLGPVKSLAQINDKVNSVQTKVVEIEGKASRPVKNVEQKINEKLSQMQKEGGEGSNLPGSIDLPGVNSPTISGVDVPKISATQDISNGSPRLSNPLGETEIRGLPDLNIPAVNETEKITEGIGEISQVTEEVSGYGEDLKNIGSGNLEEVKQIPNAIEEKAVERGGLDELQSQTTAVDEYKELLANGNDREALKQQALQQAPKLAKDHFKGQEAALEEAINKVSSLKKKYAELDNLEDLPRYVPNAMKGKPFIERIVPGLTMQIQKEKNLWLDYNLSVGYRITGKLTAGVGWNERIGITREIGFASQDRVYGPRSYVDFKIKKGFSARLAIEKMHTFIPPSLLNPNPPSDIDSYAWVWGVFAGLKKEYDFLKNVKGNFQILYNFYDDHGRSPYTNRLNVRIGFEFPMKAKKKSVEQVK